MGDDLPDGRVRGWADLVAAGLALASPTSVTYANLAIRGRLLGPIIDEQLDVAIGLRPQLLSINGGGNDIMRPRVSIEAIADRIEAAVSRATDSGVRVLLISGGNPSRHLPLGSLLETRGNQFADAVAARLPKDGVTWVDNWSDPGLSDIRYWSIDKLHLNALGHARVAGNVLAALGLPVPTAGEVPEIARPANAEYWRRFVLPWIGRRLTGRSSGDNRAPKYATLTPVELPAG